MIKNLKLKIENSKNGEVTTPFFALAPMANITTYPFASQCVKYGADIVWTPMVHTDTVLNNWDETHKIIDFEHPSCHFDQTECLPASGGEKTAGKNRSLGKLETTNMEGVSNYIIQLVGSEPEKFAESIKIIEKHGLRPFSFDINAGCPDKNIVKSGCGGALLKTPELIIDIIKACQKATKIPISVKTRAGYDNLTDILDLAPYLTKAGVSMITVHPRTVKQGYTGSADWGIVKDVKCLLANANCLVVGSGDIKTWQEATEKQKETNCDGVMIGRGALGHPWIFEEIKKQADIDLPVAKIKELAIDLARKADQIWGNHGITESRKHFAWYFRGFEGAKELRIDLMRAETLEDVVKILKNEN